MDEKVTKALAFIEECVKKYPKLAVFSSWGKDSIVILHLVLQVKPDIPVVFIDTTFKPKATYKLCKNLTKKWKLNLVTFRSKHINDEKFMKNTIINPKLWESNPDLCCKLLKVEPTKQAVKELGLTAWFSGLRATESEKRKSFKKVHKQGDFIRLHPIHDWTEADTWRYMACNKLPTHPLYGEGYRSIGCEQCSSAGGKDERSGRWKGTEKEGCGCGLHTSDMTQKRCKK